MKKKSYKIWNQEENMKKKSYKIWNQEEYIYPASFGFIPEIMSYIHESGVKKRPAVLIAPGGAYCALSPTEGEIVALKFYNMGYNIFVLSYTTNMLKMAPLNMQPLEDISRAIRYIRKNAESFQVNGDQVTVCGFSAGGHLCAGISVHYGDITDVDPEYNQISNRPDATILGYPVISSDYHYMERQTFSFLLGDEADPEQIEYMSMEKFVNTNTPPCFIWHTAKDTLVPFENSVVYAKACTDNQVPVALHIFSDGEHGLSVADADYAAGNFGEPYVTKQMVKVSEYMAENGSPLPAMDKSQMPELTENEEVAVWPAMADTFLRKVLK